MNVSAVEGNEVLLAAISMYTSKVDELKESPDDPQLLEEKDYLLKYVFEVAKIQNKVINEMRQSVANKERDKSEQDSETDNSTPSESISLASLKTKKIENLRAQRIKRRKTNVEEKRDVKMCSGLIKENESKDLVQDQVIEKKELTPVQTSLDDNSSAERFLFTLELIPTNTLHLRDKASQKVIKRGTRRKKSTANHSQYLYDDPWEDELKKKPTVSTIVKPLVADAVVKKCEELKPAAVVKQKPSLLPADKTKKTSITKLAVKPRAMQPVSQVILPKTLLPKGSQDVKPVVAVKVPVKNKKLIDSLPKPAKVMRASKSPKKQRLMEKTVILGDRTDTAVPLNLTQQASDANAPLSLLFPGLPTSLTIQRIVDRQEMCTKCKKPGVLVVSGPKVFNGQSLETCTQCKQYYHLTCSPSTSSSQCHFCPNCSSKQSSEQAPKEINESFTITDNTGKVVDNARKIELMSRNCNLLAQHANLKIVKADLAAALELQTAKLRKLTESQQSKVSMITNVQTTVSLFQRVDG